MVRLDPPLRLATEADAPVLAVLNNEASHGLSLHAWRLMAEPGADPWAVGNRAPVARGRATVAGWSSTRAPARSPGCRPGRAGVGAPAPDLPAIFHPMVELEALAPDALYVNVLATLPRRAGAGSAPG